MPRPQTISKLDRRADRSVADREGGRAPARIVRNPGTCFGKARLDGHRLWVSLFVERIESGETPATIADVYQLELAEVELALRYADLHPEEIDTEREAMRTLVREELPRLKAKYPGPEQDAMGPDAVYLPPTPAGAVIYAVRAAEWRDVRRLSALDQAWTERLRDSGLEEASEVVPPSGLLAAQQAGRLWVATAGAGSEVVGYALATVVDLCGHVAVVKVHPSHLRLGTGARLAGAAVDWCYEQGFPAATVTAVESCERWYERMGFRRLEAADLSPGLRQAITEEARAAARAVSLVPMRYEIELLRG
ncbi:MAG TPA: GNAT family N-acetyltransferase [Thermoanaerobaculia bacterium]|nr:GNAT family N-acetyltransferase [Thermoanaerobaculia bacterium]